MNKISTTTREFCTYCLRELPREQMTVDHVIAGSWFPMNTDATIQRWTVPACNDCNNHFSAIERYVHTRLAACIDPTKPAASGAWEKALRSINPERGRSDRDRSHRARQREAFRRELTEISQPPASTLPFSIPNFTEGVRTGLIIDGKKLNSLIVKWVRGIHRCVWGIPAASNTEIEVFHVTDEVAARGFKNTDGHWHALDGGIGVKIAYLTAQQNQYRITAYRFQIWEQFSCYAMVNEILGSHPTTP